MAVDAAPGDGVTMKRGALSFGFIIFLAAVTAAFVGEGLTYRYWSDFGPGPGFMPIWLGAGLAVCVVMLTVVQLRTPEVPERDGLGRVGAAILAMAVTAIAIPHVGMIPALVLMILVVLMVIEGRTWRSAALVSLGTAVVIYVIFDWWLGVQFPERYFWSGLGLPVTHA